MQHPFEEEDPGHAVTVMTFHRVKQGAMREELAMPLRPDEAQRPMDELRRAGGRRVLALRCCDIGWAC